MPTQLVVFNKKFNTLTLFKFLFLVASVSMLTTLFVQTTGEEGTYTITSLEMWYHSEYLRPLLANQYYYRPPLYNWLIIPLSSILGWDNVLIAARLITAVSSILTAWFIIVTLKKITANQDLAWLAGLLFFSFDLLARRGWLAYADSLFTLLIFMAIALLWVGLSRKNIWLVILSGLPLTMAFLTKGFIAYGFYSMAYLVLFFTISDARKTLLSLSVVIFSIITITFPIFWVVTVWGDFFARGPHGEGMLSDFVRVYGLSDVSVISLLKSILAFQLELILRLSPGFGIALAYVLFAYKKITFDPVIKKIFFITSLILLIGYFPFFIASGTAFRHIMPFYPFVAIFSACVIYTAGEKLIKPTIILSIVMIALKFPAGLFFFQWHEENNKFDVRSTVEDIVEHVGEQPLYMYSEISHGMNVAIELNLLRLPKPPLFPPSAAWDDGFIVISRPLSDPDLFLLKTYTTKGNNIYLYCKGSACPQ